MAFKHRKLFLDPTVINITAFCEPYCDPIGNIDDGDNRICPPLICKKACPYTCINPFPSLIPPLNPPPPTTTANHHKKFLQNAHLYLVISLSVLAGLCFVFSTYSIYKYYKNRNRAPSPPPPDGETRDDHEQFIDEEHGPVLDHPIWYIRTVGLQQSAINAITICKYKRGDGLVEGTECSVCLNEFQEDETLRLLPKCNHAFHLPCIDTWLRSHTNCPMCRAGIVTHTAAEAGIAEETAAAAAALAAAVLENGDDHEEEVEEGGFEGEEDETSSEEESEAQPMRRSVSLDCVSASMISNAIANANSSKDLIKTGGSSTGRCLHRDSTALKRSVSYSGNVLMKKSIARNEN